MDHPLSFLASFNLNIDLEVRHVEVVICHRLQVDVSVDQKILVCLKRGVSVMASGRLT